MLIIQLRGCDKFKQKRIQNVQEKKKKTIGERETKNEKQNGNVYNTDRQNQSTIHKPHLHKFIDVMKNFVTAGCVEMN